MSRICAFASDAACLSESLALSIDNLKYKSNEVLFMEMIPDIMEMLMVICFGISWPLNIIKAWKARTAKGTSLLFYFFIWIGYVFALIGKFVLIGLKAPAPWYETVKWYVLTFYIINVVMVSAGILIYFRNKAIDKNNKRK